MENEVEFAIEMNEKIAALLILFIEVKIKRMNQKNIKITLSYP